MDIKVNPDKKDVLWLSSVKFMNILGREYFSHIINKKFADDIIEINNAESYANLFRRTIILIKSLFIKLVKESNDDLLELPNKFKKLYPNLNKIRIDILKDLLLHKIMEPEEIFNNVYDVDSTHFDQY